MDFNEYQKKAHETADYNIIPHINVDDGNDLPLYPVLKLNGEAGEYSEKIGKIIRDENGIISQYKLLELKKELGDILWYVSENAYQLGFSLNDVAETNIEKLKSRKERDMIHGSGDER